MKVLRFTVFMLAVLTAEYATGAVIYVDENAVGPPTGVSWTNAFTNLYNALLVAQPGDEIWVAAGVYRPTDSPNRNAVLELTEGVALYGGFSGTETSRNQRNWTANQTVISGDIGIVLINTDNSRRLINVIGADAIIDGFRLRGCYNETAQGTGAINVAAGASLSMRNCSFWNNRASRAAAASVYGIAEFDNCLIEGNTNTTAGGLIHGFAGSSVVVRNCTVANNSLLGSALSIARASSSEVYVIASIIAQGSAKGSSLTHITASVSEGPIFGQGAVGTNVVIASPLFVNQATGDFRLQAGSPAIDLGALISVYSNRDFAGRPRSINGAPDAGCHEYSERPIIFVSNDANGNGSGLTWNDALTDLQAALSSATPGSEIWVKAGVYKPTPTNNRSISFVLPHDVPVYGGFAGDEYTLNDRDPFMHSTVLSGNIGSQSSDSDNSFNVVTCNSPGGVFTLDGVTVRSGYANGSNQQRRRGGGLRVNNAGVVNLYNCQFKANYAVNEGGAVFAQNTDSLYVVATHIVNNEAGSSAAIYAEAGLLLESTAIIGNSNQSTVATTGLVSVPSNDAVSLVNCTITKNEINTAMGNFLISRNGPCAIRNSIIWGNTFDQNLPVANPNTGLVVSHSVLEGSVIPNAGQEVYYEEPGFYNPNINDYRLYVGGVGYNAGDNAFISLSNVDANGELRVAITVEMGAFETIGQLKTIYVNHAATGANNGSTWEDAFTSLKHALSVSPNNRDVWVAQGVYKPSETGDPTERIEVVANGLTIYGGFQGFETNLGNRDWIEYPTVLCGDIGVAGDPSDNSHTIIEFRSNENGVNSNSLDGFIVQNGNNTQGAGGIVNLRNTALFIDNCVFKNHLVGVNGALKLSSDPGINGFAVMVHCLIYDNNVNGHSILLQDNTGLQFHNGVIANNTLANPADFAFPILGIGNSSTLVTGSIFTDPCSSTITPTPWDLSITHSLYAPNNAIQSGTSESNLVGVDPLFIDATSGNFRLQAGSPCIDAGYDFNYSAALMLDFDKNPRLSGASPDMGSFESNYGSLRGARNLSTCRADFDRDGVVGAPDLLFLLAQFGCTRDCMADLDGDNGVGTNDLLEFLIVFGLSCNQ